MKHAESGHRGAEAIRIEMQRYLDSHEEISIRSLEHLARVSRSYITRLLKKRISTRKIDISKAYRLLEVTSGEEKAREIIVSDEGMRSRLLLYIGQVEEEKERWRSASTTIEQIVRDRVSLLILMVTDTQKGSTTDEIRALVGERGVRAVSRLKELQVLTVSRGERISIHPRMRERGREPILRLPLSEWHFVISFLSEYYNPENVGKRRNYIAVVYERVSLDFLRELQSRVREVHEWAAIQMQRREYQGEEFFFLCQLMDTLQ